MNKRDAICDAALELFAEQGIEDTTIREIATQANASEGALHRHFDGKVDLASCLHARCADELYEQLTAATEGATSPADRLVGLVRGLFEFCSYVAPIGPHPATVLCAAPAGSARVRARNGRERAGPGGPQSEERVLARGALRSAVAAPPNATSTFDWKTALMAAALTELHAHE
ncbi:MAG: TetR/AcrR family transcriptional regulator [Salinivenus sp.]